MPRHRTASPSHHGDGARPAQQHHSPPKTTPRPGPDQLAPDKTHSLMDANIGGWIGRRATVQSVIALLEGQIPDSQELVDLYTSVGWIRYVQEPDELHEAVMRSTYVVIARRNDQLIGLARCLSDEVSIAYVQDILVRPEFQQQGVGRRLMEAVLNRFESVRQIGLLTDDEDRQHSFYESMGFRDIGTFEEPALHAFVVLRP